MLNPPSKSLLPLSDLVERRKIEKAEDREASEVKTLSKVQNLGDEMEDENRDKTLEEV